MSVLDNPFVLEVSTDYNEIHFRYLSAKWVFSRQLFFPTPPYTHAYILNGNKLLSDIPGRSSSPLGKRGLGTLKSNMLNPFFPLTSVGRREYENPHTWVLTKLAGLADVNPVRIGILSISFPCQRHKRGNEVLHHSSAINGLCINVQRCALCSRSLLLLILGAPSLLY